MRIKVVGYELFTRNTGPFCLQLKGTGLQWDFTCSLKAVIANNLIVPLHKPPVGRELPHYKFFTLSLAGQHCGESRKMEKFSLEQLF
jgi:hypothetical protein